MLHFVDRQPAPSLLPILRSQQQAEILVLVLGEPESEMTLTEIADRTGAPYASVHREIERGVAAGLLESRKIGNTRLVRANVDSPYFVGLADVLIKAFGPPGVIGDALAEIPGVEEAFIYGSWAANASGDASNRPVADIDLLLLGTSDRNQVYERMHTVEQRLGRPVQVTFRPSGWIDRGTGSFHSTVTGRPMVAVPLNRV
jgi:hypothetical protein